MPWLVPLLLLLSARASTVVQLSEWKISRGLCAPKLDESTALIPANRSQARLLHHDLIGRIRATDAARVTMRVAPSGQIWDWTPIDPENYLDITFVRDRHLRPIKVFVTRHRDLPDLIVQDPEKVHALEELLKVHLERAIKIEDHDLETLFARPPLTRGLIL